MTTEEQTIKALARIIVEGLVNHAQQQRNERENLRQNTQPDLLPLSVGRVLPTDVLTSING